MSAGKSRDGFAVAEEGEAGGQFVGDQLVVGWPLKGQEGGKEAADFKGPGLVMVTPRRAQGEGGGSMQPGESKTEQMGAADVQNFGGRESVEILPVEGF